MTWDRVWEGIFRERSGWGRYPPEELIRFVARHYYGVPERRAVRFLEVGCGPGAGPGWYLAREGYAYSGVDGSPTAIERSRGRFEQEGLAGEFVLGTLDALPWADATFDCVIDVACLQCNSEAGTTAAIAQILRVLKQGGRHFSLTSRAGCWGDGSGERVDATSFRDVREGPYTGMGVIRFATKESLERLYGAFEDLEIDYSVRSVDAGRREISNWIVTSRKRASK